MKNLIKEAFIINCIANDNWKYRLILRPEIALTLNHGDTFWIEDPEEYDEMEKIPYYSWFLNLDRKNQAIWGDGWYSVIRKNFRANGILEIEVVEMQDPQKSYGITETLLRDQLSQYDTNPLEINASNEEIFLFEENEKYYKKSLKNQKP